MAVVAVQCPECDSYEVVKYSQQPNGAQRYRCTNPHCPRRIFLLHYHNTGWVPEVKQQRVERALNGSSIRDTAPVLGVSQMTVMSTLKKSVCAAPGEPCADDCEGGNTPCGGDPQGEGSGVGGNVIVCRSQDTSAVAVGGARSADRPNRGLYFWSPCGSSIGETQSVA